MKDDLSYIDEIYKSGLEGYTAGESPHTRKRISIWLFWLRHRLALSIVALVLASALISMPFLFDLWVNNSSSDQIVTEEAATTTGSAAPTPATDKLTNSTDNSAEPAIKETAKPVAPTGANKFKPAETDITAPVGGTHIHLAEIDIQNTETMQMKQAAAFGRMNSLTLPFGLGMLPDTITFGSNRKTAPPLPVVSESMMSINLHAGPAYNISSLHGTDGEYLNFRNSNEGNGMGWALGADMRLNFNGFIVATGINYSSYNQSRYYSRTYQEYSAQDSHYDYDTTWVWVYNPPDIGRPVVHSIDSTWVDVYKDVIVDNSGVNTFQYIEIPLMVGYRHNFGLIALEAGAGASAAFISYSSAKVPDPGNTDDIIKVEQLRTSNINIMANITVYYQINSNTSIFVSPYYKRNLMSLYKTTYPVEQRFFSYGIDFGVNIGF